MNDLLTHPAFQAGVLPFVLALIVAELLQRAKLSGLALIAGFAATVYLTSGFGYEPLTATRKLIWLGVAAALAGLALGWLKANWLRPMLAGLAAVASVWMAWGILQQKETAALLLWGGGSALWVGWLVFWLDGYRDDPVRAGSCGIALGAGAGGASLLGASALLGQFGLALAAASAAFLLLQAATRTRLTAGRSFTLPLALLAGMVSLLTALTAQLPWYALPALALVPLAAKIPVSEQMPLWLQSALLSLATSSCAAAAIYLTWREAGAAPW